MTKRAVREVTPEEGPSGCHCQRDLDSSDRQDKSDSLDQRSTGLGAAPGSTTPMSGSASPQQKSWTACCRRLYAITQPLLHIFGQCVFGMAMLLIMAGIALCIWGYVGEAIKPFQIFGPLCIGLGFFIYFMGCLFCCREYVAFEKTIQERTKHDNVRQAVEMLNRKDIVQWIQSEPEVYEEFKGVASQILNPQEQSLENNDVIVNVYASNTTLDQT